MSRDSTVTKRPAVPQRPAPPEPVQVLPPKRKESGRKRSKQSIRDFIEANKFTNA